MKGKSLRMSLGKDKLVSLNGIKKASLICEQGKLWITGTREGDIVVKSGEKSKPAPPAQPGYSGRRGIYVLYGNKLTEQIQTCS
ncbi:MAG: hypothetical protein LRY51_09680 [Geovibrio sp.]|nr:hypothetical protein [Geovibrio sp.]